MRFGINTSRPVDAAVLVVRQRKTENVADGVLRLPPQYYEPSEGKKIGSFIFSFHRLEKGEAFHCPV